MKKALVVDDEEDIGRDLKEDLERLGFSAKTAFFGEQALVLIENEKWDLAVIDLRLATKVTGLDVIKALREKQPDAIVMAMTGYVDVGLKQQAEKLGVHEYLLKPDDVLRLEEKVKRWFENQKAQ